MGRSSITPLLSFLVLLLVQRPTIAEEFTYHYQKVIETGDGIELDLTYVDGDLQITGNDVGKLVIEAVKKVNAVSADEAEAIQAHIEIRVEQSNDKVAVSTNYLRMRDRSPSFWQKMLGLGGSGSYGEVDWVISVPDNSEIRVANTSGTVNVSHVRGSFELRSSASEVTISSFEGPVLIETPSGKTRGELLFGDVEVRQLQGEIDLLWVEGDVKVKSSSAKINVRQERGSIDLTTTTGSVTIQTNLSSSRNFFVETESGSINLMIPEWASGMLDIKSETGEIN